MTTLDIMLAASGASNDATYWIATNNGYPLGDGSDVIFSNGLLVDSSGNSYNIFINNKYTYLIKYNKNGIILWQRYVYPTSVYTRLLGCVFYNSNIVLGITGRNGSTGFGEYALVAYNSSGTIQYQTVLGKGYSNNLYSRCLLVNTTTNRLWAIGSGNAPQFMETTGTSLIGATYQSSGTTFGADDPQSAIFIGSDLYYDTFGFLRKYGTWSRQFAYGTRQLGKDSSGNLYAVGGDGSGAVLSKVNSSGTMVWEVKLANTTSTEDAFTSIYIDSSDNIFVCGQTQNSSGNLDILLAKYNTSGTLQWQRTLSTTGVDTGLKVNQGEAGVLMVYGTTTVTGATRNLLMRIPNDGSLTGTYGSFTYAISSLTASTTGRSLTTLTAPGNTATSPTIASPSYTNGTPTYTSSLTTIQ